ncbi:MAG: ComF family protein [Bacteroidales bacterium]|nr:ComF family protein [Bacteroidales bacterium]
MFQSFNIFNNIISDLSDLVCPRVCLICNNHIKVQTEILICPECTENLKKVDLFKKDQNEILSTVNLADLDFNIEYGCAFLKFDKHENTQRLLHALKYFNQPEVAVKMGRIAGYQLKNYSRFKDCDFILPIPMHPDKQKKRGYNQAERISFGLSQVLNIPIEERILKKIINTKSQTRMNKIQRKENSQNAYCAQRIEELSRKHFLIVDDVFTTGATLEVCAEALHKVMPESKISIFALAKA